MQRKDLTPWEEADGLLALSQKFGYTHEEIARKVGKSRTTVTESISIATIPESVRDRCRRADIQSKSLLLQIVRQPDEESMSRLAEEVALRGLTRDDARQERREQGYSAGRVSRTKPFKFRFVAPNREFRLEMSFKRQQVDKRELAAALRSAAESLEREAAADSEPS
jgi:ParB family chromosome partitioning protein